jgi:hypothetical protein
VIDQAAVLARFESLVSPEPTSGCWLWTNKPDHEGYGRFNFRGSLWRPHRVAWTLYRGEIPAGAYVLHRCDNRGCVNPGHLFLGTHLDNVRDMLAKGRGVNPPRTVGRFKISDSSVADLRRRVAAGETVHRLWREYGISRGYAYTIAGGDER